MIITFDTKTTDITTTNNMTANIVGAEGEENKDCFQADDVINWEVLGKTLTSLPTTFLVCSRQCLTVQVSIASGHLLRVDQTSTEPLNFKIGDALLSTGYGNPGPITMVFEHPVFGVKIKIQPDVTDDSEYSASVEAFDRLDCSISKTKHTALTQTLDNGTIYLSLLDPKGRIKKIVLSAKEQGFHRPFTINAMELKTV